MGPAGELIPGGVISLFGSCIGKKLAIVCSQWGESTLCTRYGSVKGRHSSEVRARTEVRSEGDLCIVCSGAILVPSQARFVLTVFVGVDPWGRLTRSFEIFQEQLPGFFVIITPVVR
jgi:hypothetical protein